MASPVLIAYPDIPFFALQIESAETYSDFRPVYNLIRGPRSHHAELENASNSTRLIDFNLGSSGAKSASYFILARADLLIDQGVTDFTLQRSSDGSTWTTVSTVALATNLLTGPRNQDYIGTFTETSAYRYWRVYVNGSTISRLRYSKLYFGNMFDMGVAPDAFTYQISEESNSQFIADSGAVHPEQFREPERSIIITWEGVTDAKCDYLMGSGIVNRSNCKGLFLYSPTQPQILNNDGLLHVELLSITKEDKHGFPDWNTITMSFKEMIG
jgi:hypothetical protein